MFCDTHFFVLLLYISTVNYINLKMICLRIKREWLNEIKSGRKTSEFRDLTDFYITRLFDRNKSGELIGKSDDRIKLYVGNSDIPEYAICEVKGIYVNQYFDKIPEGMNRGDMEIEIELGKIVESR